MLHRFLALFRIDVLGFPLWALLAGLAFIWFVGRATADGSVTSF